MFCQTSAFRGYKQIDTECVFLQGSGDNSEVNRRTRISSCFGRLQRICVACRVCVWVCVGVCCAMWVCYILCFVVWCVCVCVCVCALRVVKEVNKFTGRVCRMHTIRELIADKTHSSFGRERESEVCVC